MPAVQFFAHSTENDGFKTYQPLIDHLTGTADIARNLASDFGLGDFAYLVGLLHDVGKYSSEFQQRLHGAPIHVDHSTAGFHLATRLYQQHRYGSLLSPLLGYCLAGHHTGLPDFGSPLDTGSSPTLTGRLKKNVPTYSNWESEIMPSLPSLPGNIPIQIQAGHTGFSLSMLVRMIYSCLVDADFLETESFMRPEIGYRGGFPSIEMLAKKYTDYRNNRPKTTGSVNQLREKILNDCLASTYKPRGFFRLAVPTGGGKTLTSLAFALEHAVSHDLKRIIYVIPYTSIIDQNAEEFRKILGGENVLEHHSSFDWKQLAEQVGEDSDGDNYQKLKFASENWDIPITVTTNVQFFESLFSNRSSSARKLHHIARSVIILDEAQMIPRQYLRPCMLALNELVLNYHASIVLCSATQPPLERFLPPEISIEDLQKDTPALYQSLKRVTITPIGKCNDQSLIEMMAHEHQSLCIVNTRKHARGLFQMLPGDHKFHLSTLMCPAHRREVIRVVRECLENGQECHLISTQLIEAGVDIDFPVGYRAIAGLDSLVQAAGRINREGRQTIANLFVFEPDSQYVKKVPAYIQQGAAVTREIMQFHPNLEDWGSMQAYYQSLYSLIDPVAFDQYQIMKFFDKGSREEISYDFATASSRFKLIQEDTFPLVIPWDRHATGLIHRLSAERYLLPIQRELQPYTINLYESDLSYLRSKGGILDFGSTLSLKDLSLYDEKFGCQTSDNDHYFEG